MKGKVIKAISAAVIVCLMGGTGYYFYNKSAKAKAASSTNRYYTATAQKSNIDVTISATGTAEANQTKDVVSNNSGTIQSLNVKVGDTVKQGDFIAKVQDDNIDQSVNKANLAVQQQQLQVNNAKNPNDHQMQQLTLQSDQSQLNNVIEQQNQMTLSAPIGGVVVAKNNNTGDSVQAGKALITIADLSAMKLDVQVDELDIAKVKVGQAADIKFDAISDKSYTGTVESISQMGTTSNNVTTYDVIVDINNADGVKLGMNANVNIKVASKTDSLTIPVEALIERNNKKYVMIKSSNNNNRASSSNGGQGAWNRNGNNDKGSYGKSGNRNSRISASGGKLVEVQTGLENETTVEITSGLTEGQQVMIQLPQVSSSTSQRSSSGFGGFSGGSFGGLGGGSKQNNANSGNNNANNVGKSSNLSSNSASGK